MKIGICPECDGEVKVPDDVTTLTLVDCNDCGTELEVSSIDPLEFNVVEEDLDDDDDEEDF